MKCKFPKLQHLLEKENEKSLTSTQYAFVYEGHILIFNGSLTVGINIEDYIKGYMDEDDEDSYLMLDDLMNALEGKLLSKEFFNVFSKHLEITDVERNQITIVNNGLTSIHVVDKYFVKEDVKENLSWFRRVYLNDRVDSEILAIKGSSYGLIEKIFSHDLLGDSIVVERTADSICRFSIVKSPFIFGVFKYDADAEINMFNFSEGRSFFGL